MAVDGARTEKNGDVTVRSNIEGERAEPIRIDYRMRRAAASWSVIDVIIEGVSLVQNFRAQTQEIIAQDGVDRLIAKLRQKNDERDPGVGELGRRWPAALPAIHLLDGRFYAGDPHRPLRLDARARAGLLGRAGEVWGVALHDDVHARLEATRTSSARSGSSRPDAPPIPSMINIDDPLHKRRRGLVNKGFTPRRVARPRAEHPRRSAAS